MSIKLALAYDLQEEVCELFSEYINMLVEGEPSFKEYLKIQNFDDELKNLNTKYGLPNGRLYVVYYDGKLAGCIGLKQIDKQNCEMKRLYIRSEFRGKRIGEKLVQKIISDAKEIGYSYMLLDTFPFLESAIYIYKKYGFYEIESYNDNPIEASVYMKLNL